jgi:hypothetical protein
MLDEALCLSRANLPQLREFLLHGAELEETNEREDGSYDERIRRAQKQFTDFCATQLPDSLSEQMTAEITTQMQDYIFKIKEIYFEMGLQCGSNLNRQLSKEALFS